MPLTVGGCKQSVSCKADQSDKLESHQEGFKPRHCFCMQETVNRSSELTLSREKVVMSEEYSIADSKQPDFGFGVDAQTEDPLRPDSLPIRPLRMTLSWVGSPVLAPSTPS